MPLIDDDTAVTDRKRTAWPWLVVAAGFAFLWLLFALAVTFVPRAISGALTGTSTSAATAPMQVKQSSIIQQAQQMMSYGNSAQAVAMLATINPAVPMSLSDKHTYFRVSAQSLSGSGSPLAASRYYDRFLTLGVGIHSADCQSCHNSTTQIAPQQIRDLLRSDLGKGYVTALTAAGKVKATRAALEAQLRKNAKDARAHLLLYHIATAREEPGVAQKHAEAIRKLDDAAEAGNGN